MLQTRVRSLVRLQRLVTLLVQDIFDIDRFWNEELINVNQDRLFGCSFENLQTDRLEVPIAPTVKGLIGGHGYSVLRSVEYKGKRFLVIRNPWGKSEWTGPWSDGSKEWTKESMEALSVLGHEFGDDGQFIMECKLITKVMIKG